MANSYFQFKQFRIEQGHCAMKVSTDACVFGAYIPIHDAQTILDIGTGTGLLALMLAQKVANYTQNFSITAIEIDEIAAQQAKENIENSKWKNQIRVIQQSIQDYTKFGTAIGYDWIVCNPPFFVNSTLPPNTKQALAHHHTALSFEELWQVVEKLLAETGKFAVILPISESKIFTELGTQYGFSVSRQLFLQDSAKHKPHRIISIYNKNSKEQYIEEKLICKDENGQYTTEFVKLLQGYYLHL